MSRLLEDGDDFTISIPSAKQHKAALALKWASEHPNVPDFRPSGQKVDPEAPYRDPMDTPSVAGHTPLWPGGPCLPRWAEIEAATVTPFIAGIDGDGVPFPGGPAEEPPSDAQRRYLYALGDPVGTISKDEASGRIDKLLKAKKKREQELRQAHKPPAGRK